MDSLTSSVESLFPSDAADFFGVKSGGGDDDDDGDDDGNDGSDDGDEDNDLDDDGFVDFEIDDLDLVGGSGLIVGIPAFSTGANTRTRRKTRPTKHKKSRC